MIGGGLQKITVEIGGKIAASLGRSLRTAQTEVSSFGRNVTRKLNDTAIAGRKSFKGMFDNALWQQAAIGAAGIGVALGASIRTAARFEQSLTDISKTAQLGAKETKLLGQEILRLTGRNETNQSAEQLAAGIKTLTGTGLGLKDAMVAIRGIGRVATATGSDINDVANTSYQLMQNLKIASRDVAKTFEILALAGKRGSFELKDMSTYLPMIANSANSLGVTGVKGAASLAAALQITRRGAGDASTAANNLMNLLQKIQSTDAVKNFKKFGVNIEQVTKNAKAKGLNPLEETLKEIQRVTGGDQFKVSQIFADMQVKNALMPLLRDFKDYIKIRDEALGAKGVIDEDYLKQLATYKETLKSFNQSAERLGIVVGQALLPPLTLLADKITPIVSGMADWAAKNPGIAKSIVLIGGAIAGLTLALPIIAGVVSAIGVLGGPVTLTILGIGAAIALVVANWGNIKTAAAAAWGGVVSLWGKFGSWIGGVFKGALSVIQAWGPRVLGIMFPIPAMIIRLFTGAGIGQRIISSIIDGLKARAGALFSWISGAVSRVGSMLTGGGAAAPAAPANNISPLTLPGRALGGGVRAGMGYIVGERRRELFVPGMDGAIIPRIAAPVTAAALAGMLAAPTPAAAAGGRVVTINAPITINATGGDPHEIRRQVEMAFEDIMDRAESTHRVLLND